MVREHATCEVTEPIHIVLDHHAVHKSQKTRPYFEKYNLIQLFQTPYSAPFNSIEALWGLMKRRMSKILGTKEGISLSDDDFK